VRMGGEEHTRQGGQDRIGRTHNMDTGKQESMAGEWGNTFLAKKETHVQVFLQNIGGLPMDADDEVKYTHLQQFITKHKIDIIAIPQSSTNLQATIQTLTPGTNKRMVGKHSVVNGSQQA